MRLKGVIPVALLCSACFGCAGSQDPVARVGACAAAISKGAAPIGRKGECDLGRRTYLVALPRNTAPADMKAVGLPERAVLSLRTSPIVGASWCSITTQTGELPLAGHQANDGDDVYKVECVESSLEIERPALIEADALRIQVKKREDGTLVVTGVQGVSR
jgi:hypothetical protein